MPQKRTSLEAVLPAVIAPDAVAPEDARGLRKPIGKRRRVTQQTAYLPVPVYEQIRRLAFEENTKMHSLLMEGLDRVFKDRGLPSIAELRCASYRVIRVSLYTVVIVLRSA